MSLLLKFQHYIKKENLFHPKDKLLLAVSGGVDSVVLCELCKQAGYDFVIAHCNFQLRGEESERDEKFVKGLAKKYSAEVLVKKFDTEKHAAENKLSIQVAARELRYNWFHELIEASVAKYVATAHHANDNIETMLMNFFKGTGIQGLKAILPKQGNIVRPLLSVKKEELIAFAREHDLEFVEDSSNASDKYTRNYFRNQLFPDLQKVFPQVEENLAGNLQRFREIEILYQQSISQHKKKLMEQKGSEIHIPVLKLQKTEPLHSIVYEIIKDFGFTAHQTDECIALLQSETGKYIQSPTHRIIRNRKWLIISPNETTEAATVLIVEEGKIIFVPGELEIKSLPQTSNLKPQTSDLKPQTSNNIAQLDAGEIKFPLLLRKWKTGDYFYPLGMDKKKKISRFLIDQKLSLPQKENVWVIEMNKKIIWVIGLRIDNRFKITGSTKDILQISFLRK
ncbi:MAG: tRNA lysidine(34) synthetase TilS [Chitinophagaceae bacterium]|nr:tRNA lysidine(34) synthetase TilS [Chitinophagaceae bacterium]